jgi:hypothetical protein
MRVLKIADMLKHDSTVQYNQDYYEEKKETNEEKKQIAGLCVPSNIDISKFIKTDDDKIIKSISPLAVYNYQVSYHDYVQLSYLAKNASGKIFIINVIYDAVYEGDDKVVEFIKNNISFYEDKKYVDNKSKELLNKMLYNTLPTFYSDNTITIKDDNTFVLKCVVGDGVYENDTEFYFDAPIMNCIKFTEVYIKECIINNHDIVLCNIHGANDTEMNLFKVAKVLDIINIAPLNDEKTAIAIMLKIADKDDNESFVLFVCSYVNDKIKSKMNSTIDEITNMYANNEDYWLAEFFYSTTVNEEGYVIYSTKNNKSKYTTFMFNKKCVDEIEKLLNN